MNSPLWIDAATIHSALSYPDAVAAVATAVRPGWAPRRRGRSWIPSAGQLLLMPSELGDYAGVKVVTIAPANPDARTAPDQRCLRALRRRHARPDRPVRRARAHRCPDRRRLGSGGRPARSARRVSAGCLRCRPAGPRPRRGAGRDPPGTVGRRHRPYRGSSRRRGPYRREPRPGGPDPCHNGRHALHRGRRSGRVLHDRARAAVRLGGAAGARRPWWRSARTSRRPGSSTRH